MYSSFYRRSFLIATIVILGYALLRMLAPFWGALGWATFLAFLLQPLHVRLARRLRGRTGLSAGLITFLTPFVVITPLSGLAVVFVTQGANLVKYLRTIRLPPAPEMLERLEQSRGIGPLTRLISDDVTITASQLQGWLVNGAETMVRSLAAVSGNLALGVAGTVVDFFVMLFLLFFLLRDGTRIVAHLARLIPMEPAHRTELLDYLAEVTRAVVYGHAVTAVVQGTLVGIGFAVTGLPAPLVFGVIAAVAAFLPGAGTGFVLVPAVIYLAFAGHWGAAVFLGIWSVGIGLSDNILRPMLTRRRANVSTLAVFIGAIGGVAAFGIIGVVIGPVLLSLVIALLRFAEESVARKV